ncbi:MAG: hypothetical protein H7838_07575 [Magnetococcus sp. DMHC-8]
MSDKTNTSGHTIAEQLTKNLAELGQEYIDAVRGGNDDKKKMCLNMIVELQELHELLGKLAGNTGQGGHGDMVSILKEIKEGLAPLKTLEDGIRRIEDFQRMQQAVQAPYPETWRPTKAGLRADLEPYEPVLPYRR